MEWFWNIHNLELSNFRISDLADNYRLTVGGGTAAADGNCDAFAYNNAEHFTTYNRDNDKLSIKNVKKDDGMTVVILLT